MTASISEQIAKKRAAAEKKAAEAAAIKKEIRKLEQRQAAAERKARTHRLVEVGASLNRPRASRSTPRPAAPSCPRS